MEFREEFEKGLKLFEAALSEQDDRGNHLCSSELAATANMGVARCNLRLGNVRQVGRCPYCAFPMSPAILQISFSTLR